MVGFHNSETAALFQNSWYQAAFGMEYGFVKDILPGPYDVLILGRVVMNSPYWMMKELFVSSLVIYFLKYCFQRFSSKIAAGVSFTILILLTLFSYPVSSIVSACLMGMMISLYESGVDTAYLAFWIMAILMAVYVLPKPFLSTLFFGSLIIFVPKVPWLDAVFSSKPFQLLSSISWEIYSFHWPLICSVGALAIIKFSGWFGLIPAYTFSFVIVLALTVFLSAAYSCSFGRLSSCLTRETNLLVRKIVYYEVGRQAAPPPIA